MSEVRQQTGQRLGCRPVSASPSTSAQPEPAQWVLLVLFLFFAKNILHRKIYAGKVGPACSL